MARPRRWREPQSRSDCDSLLPSGDALSEAVFVPRGAAAPEGDGWLLTVAFRAAERRSEMLVLDTRDVAAGPVAAIRLPDRVPHGFHGTWVPAAA